MKCGLNNSLSFSFGGKSGNNPGAGQVNSGVVTPPDRLPNASLSTTVQSYETPKQSIGPVDKKSSRLGSVSANTAFLAMGLSLLSLLPFIRKH